jgi:hypothetical protein
VVRVVEARTPVVPQLLSQVALERQGRETTVVGLLLLGVRLVVVVVRALLARLVKRTGALPVVLVLPRLLRVLRSLMRVVAVLVETTVVVRARVVPVVAVSAVLVVALLRHREPTG